MKYFMKINPIFIFSIIIALISTFIFLIIPDSLEIFAFSGIKFISGEVWRIVTFPFTHISLNHLIENIIAIAAVSFLGYEFGLKGKQFLFYFIAVSFIIALADAFIFPLLIIAGASLGLYGIIGVLSIKGSNFIPKLYLIPLLGSSIFLKYFLTLLNCPTCSITPQTLFHFSGFLVGISLIYIPKRFKSKKYILK